MIYKLPYKNNDDKCDYSINIVPLSVESLEFAGDISYTNIQKLTYDTLYLFPERSLLTTESFRAILPAKSFTDFVDFHFEDNRMVFDTPLEAGYYELGHEDTKTILQVGTTEEIMKTHNHKVITPVYVHDLWAPVKESVQVEYNSNVFNTSTGKEEPVSVLKNVTIIDMTRVKFQDISVSIANENEWYTDEFEQDLVNMNPTFDFSVTESSEIAKGTMNINILIRTAQFTTDNPPYIPLYGFENIMVKI